MNNSILKFVKMLMFTELFAKKRQKFATDDIKPEKVKKLTTFCRKSRYLDIWWLFGNVVTWQEANDDIKPVSYVVTLLALNCCNCFIFQLLWIFFGWGLISCHNLMDSNEKVDKKTFWKKNFEIFLQKLKIFYLFNLGLF